jgi:hypothetical protein
VNGSTVKVPYDLISLLEDPINTWKFPSFTTHLCYLTSHVEISLWSMLKFTYYASPGLRLIFLKPFKSFGGSSDFLGKPMYI